MSMISKATDAEFTGSDRATITTPQGSSATKGAQKIAKGQKQATTKEQRIDAIAEYISSNDKVKEALATFRRVLVELNSSQNRKWWTKAGDSLHNLGQDITGGTNYKQQAGVTGALSTLTINDPAEEIRIEEAGKQLTALYNVAKESGLSWEDVKTAAGKAGIDLRIAINGYYGGDDTVKKWFAVMANGSYKKGSDVDFKRTSKAVNVEGQDQSFATVTNGSTALQDSDPKTLAKAAVKYDNESNRVATELKSLATQLQTSAEDLVKKVQTGQPVNTVAEKYVKSLLKIKENQEGLAKIVNEIPDGSTTDYEFVKAYAEAVKEDKLVNKSTILPQLGEILKNHPGAQEAEGIQMAGGQEALDKAKAIVTQGTGK